MGERPVSGRTEVCLRHEEVLDRFEGAWRAGQEPAIAALLEGEQGADRMSLLLALAQVDLEWRLRGGQRVNVETYLRWWPELEADATAVLELISWEWSLRGGADSDRGEFEARFSSL